MLEEGAAADAAVTRTVDTHVLELRRKLERDPARPDYIITVRKAGYRVAGIRLSQENE
ncbi:MAG: winged helix-turn-helix domain-containing protein [Rhodobacteraceae bacterium]|nr:winged helix-turn-helix domain-containing protein [Paracoccaceae bacterium]